MTIEERDLEIILMRLDQHTYKEIADLFSISGERVRQIIGKHKRTMRRRMDEIYFPHNSFFLLGTSARKVVCAILSKHRPIEFLEYRGIGLKTLEQVVRVMRAEGYWQESTQTWRERFSGSRGQIHQKG